jgi:tRNA modification GTPase
MKLEPATIFALASAPGRAGVAVIRVSGPRAGDSLQTLTRRGVPPERTAVVRTLFDKMNLPMDSALILHFSAPYSYTGEDFVEFQVHGGRAVQMAVLAALGDMPGLRPAEPGEFSRRAVENGRLDLTQAEAIADLVDAETEAQRHQALRQYGGELAALYEDWRAKLIRAAAWIEAGIDFADEDVPAEAKDTSRQILGAIAQEMRAHLDDGRRGEILREGFQVAVIGAPNAGKSSLVNALARRDVAIVSEIPGTTRDIIEVRLDVQGYPVILADTAGLRDSDDPLEQEGVRRARVRAEAADLRLLVMDGTARELPLDCAGMVPGADIVVWSKADLTTSRADDELHVSVVTGEGLDALVKRLASCAATRLSGPGESPLLTRARHRKAVETAHSALVTALGEDETELAAENARIALQAIGRITGRVDLEELLDVVFRDFCIGK